MPVIRHESSGRTTRREYVLVFLAYCKKTLFRGLFVGFLLFAFSLQLLAFSLSGGRVYAANQTQNGGVQVLSIVPGPPPTVGAEITSVTNGSNTSSQLYTLSGTCAPDTIVSIYSNNIFVGSVVCSAAGEFSIQISLFAGRNDLTALNYDTLNQPGPVTQTFTIYLYPQIIDEAVVPDGTITGDQQPITPATNTSPQDIFYVSTDFSLRGLKVGQNFKLGAKVTGGEAPYAVSVNWGDGNTNLRSLAGSGDFALNHVYKNAGSFAIKLNITDTVGRSSFIQLVSIVDGTVTTYSPSITENLITSTKGLKNITAKQAIATAGTVGVTFTIGFSLGSKYALGRLLGTVKKP